MVDSGVRLMHVHRDEQAGNCGGEKDKPHDPVKSHTPLRLL
jgi:hypothetical protein